MVGDDRAKPRGQDLSSPVPRNRLERHRRGPAQERAFQPASPCAPPGAASLPWPDSAQVGRCIRPLRSREPADRARPRLAAGSPRRSRDRSPLQRARRSPRSPSRGTPRFCAGPSSTVLMKPALQVQHHPDPMNLSPWGGTARKAPRFPRPERQEGCRRSGEGFPLGPHHGTETKTAMRFRCQIPAK